MTSGAAAGAPLFADTGDESRGLSREEAAARLRQYGYNELPAERRGRLLRLALTVVHEPMFLLLVATAAIYLILGDPAEAAVLAVAVGLIISITLVQEQKTERALEAL